MINHHDPEIIPCDPMTCDMSLSNEGWRLGWGSGTLCSHRWMGLEFVSGLGGFSLQGEGGLGAQKATVKQWKRSGF